VKWVVCSSISLRKASSKYHNELLAYHNPQVEGILPTYHTTTSKWILQAYEDAKPKVSQAIAKATSGLTISFDGWTANNGVLDLLGIMVHYLNSDY
jgi:hypothetical protein